MMLDFASSLTEAPEIIEEELTVSVLRAIGFSETEIIWDIGSVAAFLT